MTYYSAEALNGLIGRMVKVEFVDGSVETGLLSVPKPRYSLGGGRWMLYTSLNGEGLIFRRSHVKAITIANTGRMIPKKCGRPIKEDEK